MPILARYHKLELPEFERDSVVSVDNFFWDLKRAKPDSPKPETLTRFVRMFTTAPTDTNLNQLLRNADAEFEKAAKMCGAYVVPHTFGLTRTLTSDREDYDIHSSYITALHPAVPKGYGLAAVVTIIYGSDAIYPPDPNYYKIEQALNEYKTSASTRPNELEWADAGVRQFVSSQDGIFMVDVDPILGLPGVKY